MLPPYKFLRVWNGMLILTLPRYWMLGATRGERMAHIVTARGQEYIASYLAVGILGFTLDAGEIIHWFLHLYWEQPEDQVTCKQRGEQGVEIERIKSEPKIRFELFYSSLWWPKLKKLFKKGEKDEQRS